ncbi:hypothetical protein MLD38_025299 [Melastoma candidum]|uniref:Uncharacterized protein n=1 Tax=Melastoma candidum TaxID=119954 RepID=A0ACB9NUN3_9MYRT|nr:hypothetical protein MLD38_025299 [Melastoma candidum]
MGCSVLSANQFCSRRDYPPPPCYTSAGPVEDLNPDAFVCDGSISEKSLEPSSTSMWPVITAPPRSRHRYHRDSTRGLDWFKW